MEELDKVKGILGEFTKSYVVLAVTYDAPNTLQIRTDNRFAASGMVDRASDIFKENIVDEGWEIVWDSEEDDSEEDI